MGEPASGIADETIPAARGPGAPQETPARCSSRLLITMAIVRATADAGGDYLDYFSPFPTHCLKAWPDREPATPASLSQALCREFDLPPIPVDIAKILLRRPRSARRSSS